MRQMLQPQVLDDRGKLAFASWHLNLPTRREIGHRPTAAAAAAPARPDDLADAGMPSRAPHRHPQGDGGPALGTALRLGGQKVEAWGRGCCGFALRPGHRKLLTIHIVPRPDNSKMMGGNAAAASHGSSVLLHRAGLWSQNCCDRYV